MGGTYSEFDVITVRDGVVFNFQCKNNYLDISNIKTEHSDFKRRNNKLVKSYVSAYEKEVKRQKEISDELKMDKIKHFVISRYPVITRIDYIITYQNFESWLSGNFPINIELGR